MDRFTVRAKNYREFRKLIKLVYKMGYRFYSDKKYNSFWLWHGWIALSPVSGIEFQNFENSKRIKFCDYLSWIDKDYIEFNEFLLMLHGEI